MKKIIITALLLLIAVSAMSQPIVWRAEKIDVYSYEKDDIIGTKEETGAYTAILFLDLSESILTINFYSTSKTYYFTSGIHFEDIDIDKDGDRYIRVAWYAVDNEKKKCSIFQTIWPDLDIANFSVQYDDIKFLYFTRKIKP